MVRSNESEPQNNPKVLLLENFTLIKFVKLLSIFFILISISLVFIFESNFSLSNNAGFDLYRLTLLKSLNISIFILLFISYFITSKLYNDSFFYFIGLTWLLYAFSGFTSLLRFIDITNFLNFSGLSFVFNWLAIALLLFAMSIKRSQEVKITGKMKAGLILIFLSLITFAFLPSLGWSGRNSYLILIQFQLLIELVVFIGIAKQIRRRFSTSKWATLLFYSFVAFGYINLVTVFLNFLPSNLQNLDQFFYLPLLIIIIIIKILNGFSLINIISDEFINKRQEQVEHSVFEELGSLTASIEHEIRNPLAVLSAEADLLKIRHQHNPDVVKRANRIEEQIERLYTTSSMITTLRSEPEFYEQFMEESYIADMVNRSIQAVKQEFRPFNIKFEVHPLKQNLMARIDRRLFQQLLINILKNSVEAIRARGFNASGKIVVEINSESRETIVIKVLDNGSGVDTNDIPNLFSVNYSTKKDKKPNSGIGLFIANKIIKIHRGKIEVSSELGVGTTVYIYIPKYIAKRNK